MKIERFKYHEKFSVKSTFLDTAIDVEGTLDEGESLKDAVAKARAEMLKSLPSSPNQLLQEIREEPPIIHQAENRQKAKGDIIASIEDCITLDQLKEFKLLASTDTELTKLYMARLKELTHA